MAKGAKLLLGGQRLNRPGYYYPPTVMADVPDNADMMKEEIFGPVVSLQSFEDEAEAIRKANDTEYGLAAYVYTQDLKRGLADLREDRGRHDRRSIAASCRIRRRLSAASSSRAWAAKAPTTA